MSNVAAAALYAAQLAAAVRATGVPAPLLKGLVEHESLWNPRALRNEPQINDASRGLGQLLYRTAKSIGYTGTPDGLFDPATNLLFTAKYLAFQKSRTGSWDAAVSAYNGGFSPAKGMGAKLTQPTTVVLAHDPVTGAVLRTRQAQPGEYGNQPYVDAVLHLAAGFGWTGGAGVLSAGMAPLVMFVLLGLAAGKLLTKAA